MTKNNTHAHCRSEEAKQKLNLRLRRIEGQVKAVEKMINSDKSCVETMRLLSSISGALNGVWNEILRDHLKGCIKESIEQKDDSLIDELTDYLKKLH